MTITGTVRLSVCEMSECSSQCCHLITQSEPR